MAEEPTAQEDGAAPRPKKKFRSIFIPRVIAHRPRCAGCFKK